ncbi:MAG: hypothetical protein BA864_02590 [Desulfuromonadales bacterium C00003093]|nr:MAG: hypothetical protein BA864_02590 [Desulfuromonadales bacterium C00003093]
MKISVQKLAGLSRKERKDLKILTLFTSVYCVAHHSLPRRPLANLPESLQPLQRYHCCDECRDFLLYAIDRRLRCPLPEKPSCKHCQIHCYRPGHREKVREIMRYSGRVLIRKGRLDLLWHYLF